MGIVSPSAATELSSEAESFSRTNKTVTLLQWDFFLYYFKIKDLAGSGGNQLHAEANFTLSTRGF